MLPDNTDINGRSAWVAMISLGIIANLGFVIQPVLIGAMIDRIGITVNEAGLIVSGEMSGLGAASLFGAMVAHRWNRRKFAYGGILVFVLANWLSGFATSFWPLWSFRIAAGFGAGMMMAMYNAAGSATRSPERFFALAIGVFLAVGAVFILVAAKLLAAGGLMAVYVTLALLCFPVIIAAAWLPRRVVIQTMNTCAEGEPVKLLAIVSLAAMFVLFTGTSALWAYQERIGGLLDLSVDRIGVILSLATICGIVGSSIAFFAGIRIGRTTMIASSLLGLLSASLLLVYGNTEASYILAAVLIPTMWYLSLPFIVGVMAWLDKTGRLVNLGSAAYALAMGTGPAVAAWAIGDSGLYTNVGWIGVASYLVCILVYVPLTIKIDQSTRKATSAAY